MCPSNFRCAFAYRERGIESAVKSQRNDTGQVEYADRERDRAISEKTEKKEC
jgi:hypothetical protein